MKPKLKGNLAELYEQRTTLRRETASGKYVEYIKKYHYNNTYTVEICGITTHGVKVRGGIVEGCYNGNYFWQFANEKAVNNIIEHPENAYNYRDVCNGIPL